MWEVKKVICLVNFSGLQFQFAHDKDKTAWQKERKWVHNQREIKRKKKLEEDNEKVRGVNNKIIYGSKINIRTQK